MAWGLWGALRLSFSNYTQRRPEDTDSSRSNKHHMQLEYVGKVFCLSPLVLFLCPVSFSCCACHSVCLFAISYSSMLKTVDPQKSWQMKTVQGSSSQTPPFAAGSLSLLEWCSVCHFGREATVYCLLLNLPPWSDWRSWLCGHHCFRAQSFHPAWMWTPSRPVPCDRAVRVDHDVMWLVAGFTEHLYSCLGFCSWPFRAV